MNIVRALINLVPSPISRIWILKRDVLNYSVKFLVQGCSRGWQMWSTFVNLLPWKAYTVAISQLWLSTTTAVLHSTASHRKPHLQVLFGSVHNKLLKLKIYKKTAILGHCHDVSKILHETKVTFLKKSLLFSTLGIAALPSSMCSCTSLIPWAMAFLPIRSL